MNKIVKKINWFIEKLIKHFFALILSSFISRNEHYFIINAKNNANGEIFLHNTKYLFLYLNFIQSDLKITWLCDDEKMRQIFKSYGYNNVYSRKSLKGAYYALKSKYWLYDFQAYDLPTLYTHNAVLINLWHGIPLKKIGYDDNVHPIEKNLNNIQRYIYNLLVLKDSYYNTNSEYEQSCYETAFLTEKEKIKILGDPRLDALFRDFDNQQMFMEEDFNNIKSLYEQGKNLFFYVPTFRDTQKDISGWLKSEKLHKILHENNAVLVCKLHPFDKNSLDFELQEEFYKMNSDSDIYAVLKYSDALITDYSSIYFDYLLLDKPILYYVPDLEEYQEKCRGFYRPYNELTAGIKTDNTEGLIKAIQDVIDGNDEYKEQRKELCNKMFKYQDGHNCERVIKWIKSLDKKGK